MYFVLSNLIFPLVVGMLLAVFERWLNKHDD
ncbi:type I toxin-antitoxin system Fst family toxin [Lacticaseibacillus zhaodongensis]|nr:type I toxin-antitoxin system Fst family toxin [Lacticaseibacillus zhaodongensis]